MGNRLKVLAAAMVVAVGLAVFTPLQPAHAADGQAASSAQLTAQAASGVTAVPAALVTQASQSPSLNAKELLMKKGQKYKLKLSGAKKVTWKSSNKKVATVSKAGKVTAKKAGKATITAKHQGKSYKCAVTVTTGKKKSLVVYFSATGNTKAAAKKVRKAAGADIVRLQPKVAYTDADIDYSNDNCRANKEQRNDSARPALATVIRNLAQYDTVYLGYAIWWGKEPKIIRTFLEANSLKGKTVVPFCTSGGSGIDGSMANIRKFAKGATVVDGEDLTDFSLSEVKAWVAEAAE